MDDDQRARGERANGRFDNLKLRTKNALMDAGYSDWESLVSVLKREQRSLLKIPNFGRRGLMDLCDAAGVQYERVALMPRAPVNPSKIKAAITILEKNGYRVLGPK